MKREFSAESLVKRQTSSQEPSIVSGATEPRHGMATAKPTLHRVGKVKSRIPRFQPLVKVLERGAYVCDHSFETSGQRARVVGVLILFRLCAIKDKTPTSQVIRDRWSNAGAHPHFPSAHADCTCTSMSTGRSRRRPAAVAAHPAGRFTGPGLLCSAAASPPTAVTTTADGRTPGRRCWRRYLRRRERELNKIHRGRDGVVKAP